MLRPEPTPPIALLTLAYFCGILAGCQHADPKATPQSTSPPASSSVAGSPPVSAAAAVFASAAESAPAAPPKPQAAPISSVLVLGDSLSDEKAGGGGFVKVLRQRCPSVSFDNRAKGGFMVNQIRRQLEKDILPEARSYSHAIVFGGVNDLYSDKTANRTLSRIEADLSRIYTSLRERGVQIIAVTVTPWGGFKRWYTPERGRNTLTLNTWLLEQATQGNVASAVDAYPLLSCGDAERLCPELAAPHKDGLHFGKLGHQKLADALLSGPFHGCQ
jgi:lysophospholipase L1-like esterase